TRQRAPATPRAPGLAVAWSTSAPRRLGGDLEVGHERLVGLVLVVCPQHRGRMNGGDHAVRRRRPQVGLLTTVREVGTRQRLPPLLGHPERRAQDRLRRGGPETDEHPRPQQLELGEQPRPTCDDLGSVRPLVDPPLAAYLAVLEVLDRVRPVRARWVDPRVGEGPFHQPTGRPDERLALPVLLVAG